MWILKGVVWEVNSEKWSCKVKFIMWISKSELKKKVLKSEFQNVKFSSVKIPSQTGILLLKYPI